MAKQSRFECASLSLRPQAILKRGRRPLWVCLGLGMAAHLSLALLVASEAEHKAARPLTTQFVKRQPRLTKPLELKKRPQPKRRAVQRKMVAVKARVHSGQRAATFQPAQVLRGLARPTARIGRMGTLAGVGVEPEAFSESIQGSREVEDKLDMSLELLDIETLNTGRYHAMVIQDPADRHNLKGFCRLSWLYIPRLHDKTLPYKGGRESSWANYELGGCVRNLADAMNRYTAVDTYVAGRIAIDNPEAFRVPWLFHFYSIEGYGLADSELGILGGYLMQGGFIFADTHPVLQFNVAASHAKTLLAALETQGIRTVFQLLPNSHPMYHCYFDFSMPPPGGDAWKERLSQYPSERTLYLEGLEVDSRLVSVLSKKGYYTTWCGDWPTVDVTRQLQFGVNLIVFALTQEGSITNRMMDSVSH